MHPDLLYQKGVFKEVDRAFAGLVNRMFPDDDPWVGLAAGMVSRAAADGDVCLDLETIVRNGIQSNDGDPGIALDISLDRWIAVLAGASVVGARNEKKPLILDGKLLYLQRYWNYENQVAHAIKTRCQPSSLPPAAKTSGDAGYLDFHHGDDPDQVMAVEAALGRRLTVISGGPGTGKTTTIAKIILSLYRMTPEKPPSIMLAAPTGKAAARMQEALDGGLEKLVKDHNFLLPIDALEARTLHRLLGIVPARSQARYNRRRPLKADVVIVDEASMIDLALMAKLMEAVPTDARLILVGDKDQLASVEAGSVMGDICRGLSAQQIKDTPQPVKLDPGTRMSSDLVVLKHNYRFNKDSGIHDLGNAINAGDGIRAVDLLEDPRKSDIAFRDMPGYQDVEKALMEVAQETIAPIFKRVDFNGALEQFNQIKILSPLRQGPYGVVALNQLVEKFLLRLDVIHLLPQWKAQWYAGRPVMVNRNDYHHRLYNGDMGIATIDLSGGRPQVRVAFPDNDGRTRYLAPEQLPDHETVYAMSVHKSQGTEFNKVLLVLPDKDLPLLTRELIYTAVTRARHRVEIWGRREIFTNAIERRIQRASGLAGKIAADL